MRQVISEADIFGGKVDYKILSLSLVREMRGLRNQKDMDQLMGFRFNQWTKWESGQKRLNWSEFEKICIRLDIKLKPTIQSILGATFSNAATGSEIFHLFVSKFGNLDIKNISFYLGVPQSKLRRILIDGQDFEVYLLLKFMGMCTRVLPFFISNIAPQCSTPIIKSKLRQTHTQTKLEAEYPWISSLEAYLDLKPYKKLKLHSHEFLAEKLGLSIKQVQLGLKVLLKNEMIVFDGRKYLLAIKRVDMESHSLQDSARLALYLTELSKKRFATPDGIPLSQRGWAYRIFPVSAEGQNKIRKKMNEFYGDLHRIIAEDQPNDKNFVQYFLMHFFDHEEFIK